MFLPSPKGRVAGDGIPLDVSRSRCHRVLCRLSLSCVPLEPASLCVPLVQHGSTLPKARAARALWIWVVGTQGLQYVKSPMNEHWHWENHLDLRRFLISIYFHLNSSFPYISIWLANVSHICPCFFYQNTVRTLMPLRPAKAAPGAPAPRELGTEDHQKSGCCKML